MARLGTTVRAAHAAGIKVVLDMHNYAGYYLYDAASGQGVRRALGSRELPLRAFTDVWTKLSAYFAGESAVHGYALMNEPTGMAAVGTTTPATLWERATQQVVTAIRAQGDTRFVAVSGYNWSGISTWAKNHPRTWIKDPARHFSYEAHQYFDARHSGVYGSYDAELRAVATA
jgi:aryl-phospho-beta-D-glucosidase BglC (GH1 family)